MSNHRVIAVDIRGHGMSSAPPDGYTPRTFAADLAELLTRLDTGPVVAVGHSLGGAIVATLAVEYPGLVRAVVEVDPAYGVTGAFESMVLGLVASLDGPDVFEVSAATLEAFSGPSTPTALRTWRRRRVLGMRPDVLRRSLRSIYDGPDQIGRRPASDAYLSRRRCPVLTVTADADRGSWEEEIFSDDHSCLVVIEGFGHWPHQEQPDEFNQLVLDWIDHLAPSP